MTEDRFSEGELAERAGTTTQEIRRLRSAGVLVPEDDRFRTSDVLRVQVARGLEEAGVGRSVRERVLSLTYLDLLPSPRR